MLIRRTYVVFLIDLIFVHLFQVFRQEVRGYGDRVPALLGKHHLYMQGKKTHLNFPSQKKEKKYALFKYWNHF